MSANASLVEFLTAMADDELLIGHRDSEWTGHAPILEEDIAFSNIAQDEIGHGLVWYTLLETLTGRSPDHMGFARPAADFRCSRFVTHPKGDFAYTVVRQYLFDEAEQVRLASLSDCAYQPIRDAAAKILQEEAYHLLHSKGLVERLGHATEESHGRMLSAVTTAFPQALGLFEFLTAEEDLVHSHVFPGHAVLKERWLDRVVPVLEKATIAPAATRSDLSKLAGDIGGRKGTHLPFLAEALADMQRVFQSEEGAAW